MKLSVLFLFCFFKPVWHVTTTPLRTTQISSNNDDVKPLGAGAEEDWNTVKQSLSPVVVPVPAIQACVIIFSHCAQS